MDLQTLNPIRDLGIRSMESRTPVFGSKNPALIGFLPKGRRDLWWDKRFIGNDSHWGCVSSSLRSGQNPVFLVELLGMQ